jgi:predicted ribosomally synthesized peptide with nif11-like leader
MSEEQIKAFLAAVKADANLQEQLNAVADAGTLVAIAKEMGFNVSVEELQGAQQGVSEEELEDLAGAGYYSGFSTICPGGTCAMRKGGGC